MNETERASYLRSLLQLQKQQLQGNGNVLVNPSISNDVSEQAELQTDFDTTTPVVETNTNDKGNIFERVDNTIKSVAMNVMEGMYGFFDDIFDFSINTGSALGDWLVNKMGVYSRRARLNTSRTGLTAAATFETGTPHFTSTP